MLTDRDREILGTLREKVRLLSLGQIAATWWDGERAPAERRLRRLASGGWILGERVLARPVLRLDKPLFRWEPGAPPPDFGGLSWLAQSRWKCAAVPTSTWHASPIAAARLGGCAREAVKNLCQVTHDLHVGQIYLDFLRRADPRTAWWVGEDALPEGLIAPLVPDAVILRRGKIDRAIEFGGAYPSRRFETFHEHCDFLQIPYDIY